MTCFAALRDIQASICKVECESGDGSFGLLGGILFLTRSLALASRFLKVGLEGKDPLRACCMGFASESDQTNDWDIARRPIEVFSRMGSSVKKFL